MTAVVADLDGAAWATLRRLLDRALALDAAARRCWLDELGADHARFKPRLRSLLALECRTRLPLDALPAFETAQFAGLRPDARAGGRQSGDQVGPYRLLRELGAGGMAAVWLAAHAGLGASPVALKLPHGGRHRTWLAGRIARERAIVERLDHPHVVRLLDAGIAADGQPYLALEPVHGEPIDTYCTRRALGVDARLRLFLQVARAVSHVHAKGVVHRDLKPANILVATASGAAKLLDFGIAELLDDPAARGAGSRPPARCALTPDYAAPEQMRGQPVDTAADTYALGVVLFELLTGRRPCRLKPERLKREPRAALEAAIAQTETPRPSSVVTDPRLRRRLRGELDTIVGKALKKAPAERYGTVQALADDLDAVSTGR